MLRVPFSYSYAESHYDECPYAECRYAECRGAVFLWQFIPANLKFAIRAVANQSSALCGLALGLTHKY